MKSFSENACISSQAAIFDLLTLESKLNLSFTNMKNQSVIETTGISWYTAL